MPQGALRISIHISNTPFISLDGYRDYLVFHAYDARDEGKSKLKILEMTWDEAGWPVLDAHALD